MVDDTTRALGTLGNYWRRQFDIPVVAVTGSNGKTTVKEMIASILAASFGTDARLATQGNLNNEIGVPLTVMRLSGAHRAAVIELGMNHPGEIARLAAIAEPTVALVNNAQREHQEFMHTVEAVARENGAVLVSLPIDGVAVYPGDDTYSALWQELANSQGEHRSVTFGLSGDCDVRGSFIATGFGSLVTVSMIDAQFSIKLAAAGEHNVRNALAAVACAFAAGIDQDAIVRGLEAFAPVGGRLQSKQALCGATVIDDTYNANPDSVRAAIDVLVSCPAPTVLVLGDMGEVGAKGPEFHREIGAYARSRGVTELLALGDASTHAVAAFGKGAKHFNDVDELVPAIRGRTVLVKGSRFMKMERVVAALTGARTEGGH